MKKHSGALPLGKVGRVVNTIDLNPKGAEIYWASPAQVQFLYFPNIICFLQYPLDHVGNLETPLCILHPHSFLEGGMLEALTTQVCQGRDIRIGITQSGHKQGIRRPNVDIVFKQ